MPTTPSGLVLILMAAVSLKAHGVSMVSAVGPERSGEVLFYSQPQPLDLAGIRTLNVLLKSSPGGELQKDFPDLSALAALDLRREEDRAALSPLLESMAPEDRLSLIRLADSSASPEKKREIVTAVNEAFAKGRARVNLNLLQLSNSLRGALKRGEIGSEELDQLEALRIRLKALRVYGGKAEERSKQLWDHIVSLRDDEILASLREELRRLKGRTPEDGAVVSAKGIYPEAGEFHFKIDDEQPSRAESGGLAASGNAAKPVISGNMRLAPSQGVDPIILLAPYHNYKIDRIYFSPSGEKVVTVSSDRTIISETRNGQELGRIEGMYYEPIFTPDENEILLQDNNLSTYGRTVFFDLRTGSMRTGIKVHQDGDIIETNALNADGSKVLTVVETIVPDTGEIVGRRAMLWKAESGNILSEFKLPNPEGLGIAGLSPDGNLVLAEGGDSSAGKGFLAVIDAQTGKEISRIEPWRSRGNIFTAFAPDGRTVLAIGYGPNTQLYAQLWKVRANRKKLANVFPVPMTSRTVLSPDRKKLLLWGNKDIYVYEIGSGRKLAHHNILAEPSLIIEASFALQSSEIVMAIMRASGELVLRRRDSPKFNMLDLGPD